MDDSDATEPLEELRRLDPKRAADRDRDTELVGRIRAGDDRAFGELYDAWFDRIFDLVSRIVRDQEVAAEVTQDAFLSAWRKLDTLDNPAAFGGWLLRIGRNAAYNRSAKEQRSRPVDDQELSVIESVGAGASNAPSGFGVEDRLGRAATPGAALEDREVVGLVWQAAEALPERDLEVLNLQLRHGMTPAEIGEMLGLNRNAANQLVHRVRGRLEVAIRARVVWRSGEPVCEVLAQRLEQAKVTTFDAEAVRVIERHIPGCNECDERQRLRLQPAALFAALPLMVAPMFIKTQACAALSAAGVPMGGSAFAGAAPVAPAIAASPASTVSATPPPAAGPAPALDPSADGVAGVVAPVEPITMARRRSRLPLTVAAAIVALLLLFSAGLWWGGRGGGGANLVAAGVTTSFPTTTAAAALPPATGNTTTTTTAPAPSTSSAPTTAGAPTTTSTVKPTTTTTTAPTTTTTRPTFAITFVLKPPSMAATQWGAPGTSAAAVPTLTWDVAPKDQGTVSIVGPDNGKPDAVIGTTATGTYAVCPGLRSKTGCSRVAEGTYTYTLTVTGPDGTVWETRTQTLTVQLVIL